MLDWVVSTTNSQTVNPDFFSNFIVSDETTLTWDLNRPSEGFAWDCSISNHFERKIYILKTILRALIPVKIFVLILI